MVYVPNLSTQILGQELLAAASRGDDGEVAQLLTVEPGLVGWSDPEDDWSPLLGAVANGHMSVVEQLIDHGVNVNKPDAYARSPLYWASSDARMAQLLLLHGADHRKMSVEHITPLMLAAKNGHMDVVSLLLAHDPSSVHVELVDDSGSTAAWIAAENLQGDIVRLLLDHGAKHRNENQQETSTRPRKMTMLRNIATTICKRLHPSTITSHRPSDDSTTHLNSSL